jgi:hypothetical protein
MRTKRFTDWKDAHTAAVEYARDTQHDVALRRVREFGKTGFNISLASRNDSDYALAEIVTPTDPF